MTSLLSICLSLCLSVLYFYLQKVHFIPVIFLKHKYVKPTPYWK